MNETWKAIPGFPGYQASDLGAIRYLLRWKAPRILTQGLHTRGYLKVGVSVDGKTKTVLVHRLIALAFVANPDALPHVNHRDAIKTNNLPSNLEWTSPLLNSAHAKRAGLYQTGEKHHHVRFTDAQVTEMRRLMETGLTPGKVAKMFGTNRYYMRNIKIGAYRAMLSAAEAEGRKS